MHGINYNNKTLFCIHFILFFLCLLFFSINLFIISCIYLSLYLFVRLFIYLIIYLYIFIKFFYRQGPIKLLFLIYFIPFLSSSNFLFDSYNPVYTIIQQSPSIFVFQYHCPCIYSLFMTLRCIHCCSSLSYEWFLPHNNRIMLE